MWKERGDGRMNPRGAARLAGGRAWYNPCMAVNPVKRRKRRPLKRAATFALAANLFTGAALVLEQHPHTELIQGHPEPELTRPIWVSTATITTLSADYFNLSDFQ
jgi:hypothetical protein